MADVSFLSPQKNQCILPTHTEALSRAARGIGVVNGNSVIPTVPASLAVTVEAGRIRVNAPLDVTQANVSLQTANGYMPRIDIIYRNASGTPQVATGTPNAIEDPKSLGEWKSYTSPTPPENLPAGVILGAVYVPPGATSISSGYIWMFAAGVEDISTSMADPGSDSLSASEKAVRTLSATKINTSDIVTSVGNPGSDQKVPSEKATRTLAGTLAPAAKGVTNGDSHDHSGGDGGQIDHTALSNAGTNTHSAIDSHIASTLNPHGTTAAQVGADVTTASIHAATSKTTPADNDELALVDSAASWILKKLTWSNLKAALKTYLDAYYILQTVLTTRGDILVRDATGPARLPKGAAGQTIIQGANDPAWTTRTFDVEYVIGSGAEVIPQGASVEFRIPIACNIVAARIRENLTLTGSITIDVYQRNWASDTWTQKDSFSISNGLKMVETGLSIPVAAGDWVNVVVSSISNFKQVLLVLQCEAT